MTTPAVQRSEPTGSSTAGRRPTLLVIGDTDSYVKWGAALASRLPDGWDAELVVVRNPMRPSARQLASALAGSRFAPDDARDTTLADLGTLVRSLKPEAVLLSVRGPMVRVLVRHVVSREWRPVIVSGLPGITIPAAVKAVVYREQADLVVLHSKREVREFAANARSLGVSTRFGLATFPFIPDVVPVAAHAAVGRIAAPASEHVEGVGTATAHGGADRGDVAERRRDSIVFATQAKVPSSRADRLLLLSWLVRLARSQPESRVVIKVRALAGEAQTHAEQWDYAGLLEAPELPALADGPVPGNLVVADGPMSEHLERASAFVTISSTAALEAVAADVPALLPTDFGVNARLINLVFEGSGLLAGSDALVAGRFAEPDPAWRDDNYLHGRANDDWAEALEALVRRERVARTNVLPQRFNRIGWGIRRAWERKRMLGDEDRTLSGSVAVAIAVPARRVVRVVRRIVRRAAA
ncbi:hypothetical protein ELQ92_04035 [Labedella populi]|uniref:Uncharacterized protein n=1 Tax=Labedella populi TaxID=2498850 RepID=A0A3S4CEX6_9MICO|nr:DUF6716 putative glycosyltransferase [Labedella populi]RWZ68396.1 hypothetical protein ELQ92_04035 [Labedella populi]